MFLILKALVLMAWLAMLAALFFAPWDVSPAYRQQVVLYAPGCGPELEMVVKRSLRKLDRSSQLVLVDDLESRERILVLERLLLMHPGVVLRPVVTEPSETV